MPHPSLISLALICLLSLPQAHARPRVSPALFRPLRAERARAIVRHRCLDLAGLRAMALPGGQSLVEGPSRALAALADRDCVDDMEAPARLRVMLDQSGPLVGAGHRGLDGLDGSGVALALIDSGIDWHHPAFLKEDGTTRIAALLDLSLEGDASHPELPRPEGALYLADDINRALRGEGDILSQDVMGHGTQVAAIAASSAEPYRGVAPGATLIVVKASRANEGEFDEADVLASARFAHAMADALGLPLVVNLSLGGHRGAHDGTSPLEQGLSALPAVVVVAAGNDGGQDIHASGRVVGLGSLAFEVPAWSTRVGRSFSLDAWSSRPLTLSLVSPHGDRYIGEGEILSDEAQVVIQTAREPNLHGLWEILVIMGEGTEGGIASGHWVMHLEGEGTLDAWVAEASPPERAATPRFIDMVDPTGLIALPATAEGVMAVGSLASRDRWPGLAEAMEVDVGQLSVFTPPGPTLAQAIRPDLLAPGEYIVAPFSQGAEPQWAYYVQGEGAQAGRGTSFASPHVAGAAALLLQQNPQASSQTIRDILQASSRSAWDLPPWGQASGFGLLDAALAVEVLQGRWGGRPSAHHTALALSRTDIPPGEYARVIVVPRDEEGRPSGPGLDVVAAVEGLGYTEEVLDWGNGTYRTKVHALEGDLEARLVVMVEGVELQRALVLEEAPRLPFPASVSGGGGCSLGGEGEYGLAMMVLLAALLWLRRSLFT